MYILIYMYIYIYMACFITGLPVTTALGQLVVDFRKLKYDIIADNVHKIGI